MTVSARGPDPRQWLWPDWAPHPRVRACVTTRTGLLSPPPWQGFNLGDHCGDDPRRVRQARTHVQRALGLPQAPHWLRQVHGTTVVEAGAGLTEADGVWTRCAGRACVVLTADCLPVLMAREDGRGVAAVHAGWRGLHQGILERAVARLAPAGESLSVWIGPAICQDCYQVGSEVREAFLTVQPEACGAFRADAEPGRWRFSLVAAARLRLQAVGVQEVLGGELCTACDDRFYSFRQASPTGRFASLIWLRDQG